MASSGTGTTTSSPCGACKFLRRKCTRDCIFAPYFNCEQGPARFAAIHKVFGASNVSKLLLHVPVPERCEAVVTISYEAQARIRDPVYGCVSHIFALQHQVALLQAQVMQMKVQLAQKTTAMTATTMASRSSSSQNHRHHYWQGINNGDINSETFGHPNYVCMQMQSMSPQSSLDSCCAEGILMPSCLSSEGVVTTQLCTKRKAPFDELGELQALALRMMKS
ncbi:Lateral organ boundaries LOB domain-containing protein [Dioscorea alata]|uniref:Lateral organ boundaries LOB domain-containing protein n=1 Tax=Dioscorea alata TaxID=55571 RepID=A0ACB7WSB7_DIOAL|nr:Lateral organ boundaries LOB domain-containing protein [Dioscorea alata]